MSLAFLYPSFNIGIQDEIKDSVLMMFIEKSIKLFDIRCSKLIVTTEPVLVTLSIFPLEKIFELNTNSAF
jgi:hypothetical protein